MERVERSVEIEAPRRTVYDQWTQFEEFPRFVSGVKHVRQLDETHVRWHANVSGVSQKWDAEITEQIPDERIAWRSTAGERVNGSVCFEALPDDRALVRIELLYGLEGAADDGGDARGLVAQQVEQTLRDFKAYIEQRQVADGAWRGEVHGGERRARSDESAGRR
jgi:uncharacterized membrane protein